MSLYTRRKKQQMLKDMKKYERKSTNDDGIHPKSKQLKDGHKDEESSETETAPDYIIIYYIFVKITSLSIFSEWE